MTAEVFSSTVEKHELRNSARAKTQAGDRLTSLGDLRHDSMALWLCKFMKRKKPNRKEIKNEKESIASSTSCASSATHDFCCK